MARFLVKSQRKIGTLLMMGSFLFLFFIISAPKAQAAGATLRGLAYWGDNGYLSFNCLDDISGDHLDTDQNLYNLPEPRGFHFFVSPCLFDQHAVSIDANNNFSGKAWNYSQGSVSFSGSETPPDGYSSTSAAGNCPNKCNASNNCWACYNEAQQKVYGWAKIDNDSDSGTKWINLSDSSLVPTISPVRLKTCNNSGTFPAYPVSPGDFIGYATNGHGNLSFNCASDTDSDACLNRNGYRVYIGNLSIGSLTAPSWSYDTACAGNALGADLGWCVKSGTQAAYEVVVNETDFGPVPNTGAALCWSGIISSSIAADFYPHISCPNKLDYGKNYYWWIRLYDSNSSSTDWYQYYGNSAADSDHNVDNNVKTFTTYKHEFPTPYFTWSPQDPIVGSTTKFVSDAYYYTNLNPKTKLPCTSSTCVYSWWSSRADTDIASSTYPNTDITFSQATSTDISLKITDRSAEQYYCTKAQTIYNINYGLPIWREIKAQ